MNQQLSPSEVAALGVPLSDKPLPVTMTRREKLLRFAEVVRASYVPCHLYHLLENYSDAQYAKLSITGAFYIAATDPVLREAGFTGRNVLEAKRFFELSRDDLHEFSCNCGGELSNGEQADRIERIANTPASVGLMARIINSVSWTGRA